MVECYIHRFWPTCIDSSGFKLQRSAASTEGKLLLLLYKDARSPYQNSMGAYQNSMGTYQNSMGAYQNSMGAYQNGRSAYQSCASLAS